MKRLKLTAAIAALVGGLSLSGVAQADFSANMSRIAGASGSGHTVIDQCGDGIENWDGASATIENVQDGGSSRVKFRLKGGKPNTHYTVWVRLKGQSHGEGFGGSPITGGGATPLAPGSALDDLVADWVGAGSTDGANSFDTNHQGDATVHIDLDFPLEGGAVPFNQMSAASLAAAEAKRGINLVAAPTAIADPRADNVGPGSTPFLIRMVSHCQDGTGHGLSPSNREAWFQYP